MAENKIVKVGEAVGVIAAQSIGEPGTSSWPSGRNQFPNNQGGETKPYQAKVKRKKKTKGLICLK